MPTNPTPGLPGKPKLKPKSIFKSGVVIAIAILIFAGGSLFETNDRENYQVKQAFMTGTMTCRTTPGTYGQMLGDINTYKVANQYFFSKHNEEGGTGLSAAPINATFNGRSKADVTGFLKYELPADCDKLKALDKKYGSNNIIRNEVIRQTVTEAIIQTATLFTAEEADVPRRDQFREIALAQIKDGIYKKKIRVEEYSDPSNPKKKLRRQITELYKDKNGNPVVVEASPLKDFGIKVVTFNVKDLDWDDVTDRLLAKKKEIDMQRTLSKSAAVTAQQNAVTAEATGRAKVAIAKAKALVIKETAVIAEEQEKEVEAIRAAKKYEIAKYAAKEALENAKKVRANGMAKAAANQALVKAGLTPIEAANIKKDTMIGMMEAWAKRPVPTTVFGGGSKSGGSMVMDMLGVDAAFNAVNRMNKKARK
jgi:hypothetical protein